MTGTELANRTGSRAVLWFTVAVACAPLWFSGARALADDAPPPALVVGGDDERFQAAGLRTMLRADIRTEDVNAFPIDHRKTVFDHAGAINTRFRLTAAYRSPRENNWLHLLMLYEHDLATGVVSGGGADVEGQFLPNDGGWDVQQITTQGSAVGICVPLATSQSKPSATRH